MAYEVVLEISFDDEMMNQAMTDRELAESIAVTIADEWGEMAPIVTVLEYGRT